MTITYGFLSSIDTSDIINGVCTIPDEVTEIDAFTFYNYESITDIKMSDNVKRISAHAFKDCKNLKTVTLSNNITIIFECAFARCVSLESINLPDNLLYICNGAFYKCDNLDEETKEKIKNINPKAFDSGIYE